MEFYLTGVCIKNYGISFSFIKDSPEYFIVILGIISLLLVISVIIFLLIKAKKRTALIASGSIKEIFINRLYLFSLQFSLFIIIVGGLINTISRAISGYVCDYIAFSIGRQTTYFNAPDILIVSGIIIFIVAELFFNKTED